MPVVTGVKERRGRARVFVDGALWAELDSGVVAERGLREGTTICHEELAEARVAGERPLAMNLALHSLGYRVRSAHELRERLSRAGYAGETVRGVLARLEELGYLDDDEFARNAARDKARKRYMESSGAPASTKRSPKESSRRSLQGDPSSKRPAQRCSGGIIQGRDPTPRRGGSTGS